MKNIILIITIALCSCGDSTKSTAKSMYNDKNDSSFIRTEDSSGATFEITPPPSWYSGNANMIMKNVRNFKFTESEFSEINKELDRSEQLAMYYKYDTAKHAGLVPTIKIYSRPDKTTIITEFLAQRKEALSNISAGVANFRFIDEPKIVSSHNAVSAQFSYELPVKTGETAYIRTRVFYLLLRNRYIEISMMDNEAEDCQKEFEAVINSVIGH